MGDRQAIRPSAASDIKPLRLNDGGPGLRRFHQGEPFLKRMSRRRSGFQSQTSFRELRMRLIPADRGENFTDGAACAKFEETAMLRKLGLVGVAAASLGAAALAPTSASAWHGGGWHRGGWGGPPVIVGGPAYYGSYGYGGCTVRRLVPTAWGPRWRLINRCY
jgi:hypothetical protein